MIVNLQVPILLDCEIVGYVYDSDDPADLGESMAEIMTAGGVLIEVGWFPEGDANGSYRVAATLGMQNLCKPYKTTDIHDAVGRAEVWAKFFSGMAMPGGASSSTTTTASPIECDPVNTEMPGRPAQVTSTS